MKTNITYQDNWDEEDSEIFVCASDVAAVPSVGEIVVLFPDGGDERGIKLRVRDRLWTVFGVGTPEDPSPVQHVTVLVEKLGA